MSPESLSNSIMVQPKSRLANVLAWFLFLGIVGLTTLGFFTRNYGWKVYFELLSHFQLQYFSLSSISLGILIVLRRRSLFLLGLVCTVILGTQLVTWYLPPKLLITSESSNFRVLLANVNKQNKQYEDVLAFTRQEAPDLALFIETGNAWIRQLDTLRDTLPYASSEAIPYNFGMVMYSRYPFDAVEVMPSGEERISSLTGQISVNNQTFSWVGMHPLPPFRHNFFASRNKQLDLVGQYLQTVESPKMLIGDLNLSMWSAYYERLTRQTNLKNARKGFGILPSWPASGSYLPIPRWGSWLFAIPIESLSIKS